MDPEKGSDSNSGSESAPFRTIQHGVDATRSAGGSERMLVLRGGLYSLPGTIELSGQDSGLVI